MMSGKDIRVRKSNGVPVWHGSVRGKPAFDEPDYERVPTDDPRAAALLATLRLPQPSSPVKTDLEKVVDELEVRMPGFKTAVGL